MQPQQKKIGKESLTVVSKLFRFFENRLYAWLGLWLKMLLEKGGSIWCQVCIAFVTLRSGYFSDDGKRLCFLDLPWKHYFFKNVVLGMASKHLHSFQMELLLGSSYLVTQSEQGVKLYRIYLHDNHNPLYYQRKKSCSILKGEGG